MTVDAVMGLDIGTTTAKAVVTRLDDQRHVVVDVPTRWTNVPGGGSEIDPVAFLSATKQLMALSVDAADSAWGSTRVLALSITGLAESGVLLDPHGEVAQRAIAWFDPRGQDELVAMARSEPDLAAAFPGLTGLPWSAQASFAKLLWLRRQLPSLCGYRWLNIPEWLAFQLGAEQAREPSLASRTGLIDQNTGEPHPDLLSAVGADAGLLPPPAVAGTPLGAVNCAGVPAAVRQALISVAGHDHPVAALAVGAAGVGALFNSSGTADVLVRAVAAPLTDRQRAAIVAAGWSAGAHVTPGVDVLLAGGSGGLLLRRVLLALGSAEPELRTALDSDALAITDVPAGLVVTGDSRVRDDVEIRLRDDATPAAIWVAATKYTAELARGMLAEIEPVVGTHDHVVAAGGWTRMASVRKAKAAALGDIRFSTADQPGAQGAALFARRSLEGNHRTPPVSSNSAAR